MELTCEAYAKINWCLDVVGKRNDGYHLLDMVMQPVTLHDTLTIRSSDTLSLRVSDSTVPAGPDNLVLRAARLLLPFSGGRGADMTLIKRIPSGAGLGGGSADAACALRALRTFWKLPLSDADLCRIGLSAGADVPFCVLNTPARVRGIGEKLQPVRLDRPACLLIIKPDQSLSTPAVFQAYDKAPGSSVSDIEKGLSALRNGEYHLLRDLFFNALYPPALSFLPELSGILSALYREGAQYAAMSGSGSALFGVFQNKTGAAQARTALEKSLKHVRIFDAETLVQDTSTPLM